MKDLVEKYLKQKEYYDKAESKCRFWRGKSNKTLQDLQSQLSKKGLLNEGNVIDAGNGMIIKVSDCVRFWSPCIEIKEKKNLKE